MIQNVRHRVCFATEIMGTAIVLNPHRSHAPRQGAMLQTIHYADVKQPKQVKKTKKYIYIRDSEPDRSTSAQLGRLLV